MARPGVIGPEQKQRIRDLHAAGKSRNEIARELGVADATITWHCRRMGLPFDRTSTKIAVAARQADMRAWRAAKLADLAEKIDQELNRWRQPVNVWNIGGRENVYTEERLPEPPADMRYTMSRTIAVLMDQHLKIAAFDAAKEDNGASDVDAWLESMTAGAGH